MPLRLHGDGVPIAKGKKRTLDIISFSSMVGERGSTWETRFFLSGVVSDAKKIPPPRPCTRFGRFCYGPLVAW